MSTTAAAPAAGGADKSPQPADENSTAAAAAAAAAAAGSEGPGGELSDSHWSPGLRIHSTVLRDTFELKKKSGKLVAKKQRLFVLEDSVLTYFNPAQSGGAPKETIYIKTGLTGVNVDNATLFLSLESGETYRLKHQDAEVVATWYKTLQSRSKFYQVDDGGAMWVDFAPRTPVGALIEDILSNHGPAGVLIQDIKPFSILNQVPGMRKGCKLLMGFASPKGSGKGEKPFEQDFQYASVGKVKEFIVAFYSHPKTIVFGQAAAHEQGYSTVKSLEAALDAFNNHGDGEEEDDDDDFEHPEDEVLEEGEEPLGDDDDDEYADAVDRDEDGGEDDAASPSIPLPEGATDDDDAPLNFEAEVERTASQRELDANAAFFAAKAKEEQEKAHSDHEDEEEDHGDEEDGNDDDNDDDDDDEDEDEEATADSVQDDDADGDDGHSVKTEKEVDEARVLAEAQQMFDEGKLSAEELESFKASSPKSSPVAKKKTVRKVRKGSATAKTKASPTRRGSGRGRGRGRGSRIASGRGGRGRASATGRGRGTVARSRSLSSPSRGAGRGRGRSRGRGSSPTMRGASLAVVAARRTSGGRGRGRGMTRAGSGGALARGSAVRRTSAGKTTASRGRGRGRGTSTGRGRGTSTARGRGLRTGRGRGRGTATGAKKKKKAPVVDPMWLKAQPKIVEFYKANFPDKVEKITAFLTKNQGKEKKVIEGLLKQYAEQASSFFVEEAKVLQDEADI